MIVPNPSVKGGIASVVAGYRGSSLEKNTKSLMWNLTGTAPDGRNWAKRFQVIVPFWDSCVETGRTSFMCILPSVPVFIGKYHLSI